ASLVAAELDPGEERRRAPEIVLRPFGERVVVALGTAELGPPEELGCRSRQLLGLRLTVLAVDHHERALRSLRDLSLGRDHVGDDVVPAAVAVELLRQPGRERVATLLGEAVVLRDHAVAPDGGEMLAVSGTGE